MAFFNLFPLILQYYQFVAMCPISLPREKSQVNMNNWFLIIWSIINVIFLCFLTVLFLIYSDIIYDENNDIGRFQDIVKFGTILLTHFFILVETLYTRRHQFEFWQLRNQVDACLEEMDIEPTIYRRKFETDYTKKFISYQVVTWIVEIYIISTVQDDIQWLEFWYATIYSLMMTRSRHFQHSMYIDLITARFKAMKHELNTMVQLSKKGSIDETHNKRMLQKLKLMRSAYNTLYEMNGHLNKSIGLSQLFNFMQNFIQLTSDLYWIYSVLYKNTFEHLFQISLNLIPTFWSVIAVLYSSEKCLKNANFIGFLLHNIEKGNDNRQLDLLIENFSLQILHEPIGFTVSGFFSMDFMFLKEMAAAITTYMVIFIQFMPKEPEQVPNATTTATIVADQTTTAASITTALITTTMSATTEFLTTEIN